MSVYYYEGAEILAPLTITSNEPMFDVDTVSLKKQRASQNAQRWELSFNTIAEPSTQVDLFLSSVENLDTVTTMVMPQLPKVDELYTLTQTSSNVNSAAAAGATTVGVSAATTTGFLPKGSFIKFSNHSKVYVTTSDTTFTSGTVNVNIYPSLRTSITTADLFRTNSECQLTYLRSIDQQTGITFTDGVLASVGTIDLIEAL